MEERAEEGIDGASLGFPSYVDLRPARGRRTDAGPGHLFETFDAVHRRRIMVRIGRGDDARTITRSFESWREFGTHPNVVTVFDLRLGADGDAVAMETECSPGSLRARLDAERSLPFVQVLSLGHGIVSGLSEMHGAGVVHGSLDVDHVELSSDDRPQIGGIGLAREAGAPPDPRADLSAVGAILAAALGGTIEGEGADARLLRRSHRDLDEIPVSVSTLIERLAADPAMSTEVALEELSASCRHYLGHVPDAVGTWTRLAPGARSDGDEYPTGSGTAGSRQTSTFHPAPTPGDVRRPAAIETPHAPPPPPGRDDGTEIASPVPTRPARGWVMLGLAVIAAFMLAAGLSWWLSSDREEPRVAVGGDSQASSSLDDVVVEPPASTSVPGPVVSPSAPSDLRLEFIAPGRAMVSWTDNSSSESGYVAKVGQFRVGADGSVAAEPEVEGWVDATGLLVSDSKQLDVLDPNTTSVQLQLDDLSLVTCVRPVAVSSAGASPSAEQTCAPVVGPAAPAVGYGELNVASAGETQLVWQDNSLDEHHFTLLEVDPTTSRIVRFSRVPADTNSLVVTLSPGSASCFLVRAENAANTDATPTGQLPRADGSNSATFCFTVR